MGDERLHSHTAGFRQQKWSTNAHITCTRASQASKTQSNGCLCKATTHSILSRACRTAPSPEGKHQTTTIERVPNGTWWPKVGFLASTARTGEQIRGWLVCCGLVPARTMLTGEDAAPPSCKWMGFPRPFTRRMQQSRQQEQLSRVGLARVAPAITAGTANACSTSWPA